MAVYKMNSFIGYKQSFVFGKTLSKRTISFHSKAKISELNNSFETCCQPDFRLPYLYRIDNRTKNMYQHEEVLNIVMVYVCDPYKIQITHLS